MPRSTSPGSPGALLIAALLVACAAAGSASAQEPVRAGVAAGLASGLATAAANPVQPVAVRDEPACGHARRRLWVEGEGWVVRRIATCR